MREIKNPFMPGDKDLFLYLENRQTRFLSELTQNDYREKDKELITALKDLPPEHLTATYWG